GRFLERLEPYDPLGDVERSFGGGLLKGLRLPGRADSGINPEPCVGTSDLAPAIPLRFPFENGVQVGNVQRAGAELFDERAGDGGGLSRMDERTAHGGVLIAATRDGMYDLAGAQIENGNDKHLPTFRDRANVVQRHVPV